MSGTLTGNVFLVGHGWFGPSYPDAGNPPAGLITNPACWDGDPPAGSSAAETSPENPRPADGPPPRSGKGATDEAWTEYARANGVAVEDSMSRSEVIAACDAAGVPTK